MNGQAEPGSPRTKLGALAILGITVTVVGLLGVGLWGLISTFDSGYGSVAGDSAAAEIVEVGVEDPVNNPDHWVGWNENHVIVWEGTEAEYKALTDEGRAAHQADLRRTWLLPSAVITSAGVLLMVGGLARKRTR